MHLPFSIQHPTHRESLWRFLLLLAILIAYFGYLSWKFDATTGAWLAALSWSFFVLCTPVADGGFIIAFPLRMLFGVRMLWTQVGVWGMAVALNLIVLSLVPEAYDDSVLTRLLKTLLTVPWPNWSMLALSAIGTGLSIWFGDEMIDVTAHRDRQKHHSHGFQFKIIAAISLGVLTIIAYYNLLEELGVQVPGT
ncbi:hypothetical protein [Salipiger bermudensis]|uniref:hypothetical protein n=1 Tax=Salipiger bermudensis TaxID=344736 RepID=UPI001CD72AED|nr:hypothetical protein [Salipiger bermudensis]MCA0964778.1 hypothetical protein [Salipiger bermudensis]